MFGNGLCHAVEYTFQIMHFARVLNFYDDNIALAVFGLDIHAVELIIFSLLVAFTFQDLNDFDRFTNEHGEEPLKDIEVGLLSQQAFDSPVEAYTPAS